MDRPSGPEDDLDDDENEDEDEFDYEEEDRGDDQRCIDCGEYLDECVCDTLD